MRLRPLGALVLALSVAAPYARAAEPWVAPVFMGPGSHPVSGGPKGPKPPPPPPPPATPADVEVAEQQYAKLEFDEANKTADRVVKLRGLSHDQLVRAYRILAVTHAFIDHEDPARDAFIQLLAYDPDYQVDPNLGPKVTTPFMEARGFWRSQPTKPSIEVAATVRANEPGALRVTTRDPTHIVKKVTVGYRWTSSGDYATSTVAVGNAVSVDVPVPPQGKTRLEYYAQALDDREDVAWENGNPGAPKTAIVDTSGVAVTPPAPKEPESGGGIASSPVFWTVTALVVAGAAVGGFFLFRPKDTSAPTAAALSPTLQCGGGKCQ